MTLEPYTLNVRYGRLREEVKIRTLARRGAVKTGAVMTSGMYRLREACVNDVGYYYCARDDNACLCGFKGRGALGVHLRPAGVCIRCGVRPDVHETGSHPFHANTDANTAPHVLVWICRYHGPEVMRPMDADEPINADLRNIANNAQWAEYMERLAARGANPVTRRLN